MPTPTIPDGKLFFNAITWTGTSTASGRTFTNGAPGQSFQPDFVWAKSRSGAYNHQLYDSNRGVGRRIASNTTDAETTNPINGYISSFNSNGFTTIAGTTDNSWFNETNTTYVAWQWKAGGTAVSNTAGTITSSVSANTTSGFSVVTYTGNGTSGATVGHGLGVAPRMVIIKRRDGAEAWPVYHASLPSASYYLRLQATDAQDTAASFMNNTAPSSSVFTLGNGGFSNTNNWTYVAYCWSEIAGFSKFGSYTGNGSADGPFVYTGFRPRFVMIKLSSAAGANWEIYDSARNTSNATDLLLLPSSSSAEGTFGSYPIDLLSNGFKIRGTGSGLNDSGQTLIYACFAENPFKYANAR